MLQLDFANDQVDGSVVKTQKEGTTAKPIYNILLDHEAVLTATVSDSKIGSIWLRKCANHFVSEEKVSQFRLLLDNFNAYRTSY